MKQIISITVLLLQIGISASASALCTPVTPDSYYLGTGIDQSGLCIALNTGASAQAALDLVDTQNQSLLKQAAQYAKAVEEVQNLIIQTEMMIKDLEENPLEVVTPDIAQIIANQARIDKLADDIGNNSNKIGDNLLKDLKNPKTLGLGHGSKFQLWSETRRKNVEESYAKVVQFIKDEKKENEDAQTEAKNAAGLVDKTQAAKTAARIASQQLNTSNKMLEVLNQLLGSTATKEGSMLREEQETNAALDDYVKQGPLTVEHDTYEWKKKGSGGAF